MSVASPLPPRTTLYGQAELAKLLAPRSVAVLGASTRSGSFGERTVANLSEFRGSVYPINPKYDSVLGRACYPSLASLPDIPDCVVIASNRDLVQSMVEDCIDAGVGGILIYASGYSETGKPERLLLQQELGRLARKSGVPIIGPNCLGFHNLDLRMAGSFNPAVLPEHVSAAPAIGLITQSGALGVSLLQGLKTGMKISHVLTSGNSCDVDVADYVRYLVEDPGCHAIGCLFEGMSDPRRMLDAAAFAWEHNKPLVIYKIATGDEGAKAAVSHTGSLAGSNAAYRAAFERAGVVVVDDFEALIETTSFLAKAGSPSSHGVAVMSTSGGASIICADKAEIHGVPLPQPLPETTEALAAHIPEFGSARNPCDITAQVLANPHSLVACCEAVLSDPTYGAMVTPHVFAVETAVPRMKMFGDMARTHRKPVCLIWMSLWLDGPGRLEAELDGDLAVFSSADRCFAAIASWQKRGDARKRPKTDTARRSSSEAASAARALLGKAGGNVLTERESKDLLALYGVDVTREMLATSTASATAIAGELGYPVVMKVESADIPHKTETDTIRLNLKSPADIAVAFDEIMANAARVEPPARINGVLVQQMIPPGLEIVVGARTDPLFGPLVLAGLGGVFVELMKDTAVSPAPVTIEQALKMLNRLRGHQVLDGFRGAKPVDRAQLADTIVRISELAADLATHVTEIDVNPLICGAGKIVAVDALFSVNQDHKETTHGRF